MDVKKFLNTGPWITFCNLQWQRKSFIWLALSLWPCSA